MPRVLGIDPGMMTGWGEINDEGVYSGVWDLKAEGAQHHPLWVLGRRLTNVIDLYAPTLICYEEPVARGMAARSLNRQLGVIIYVCEHRLVPHYPVNPGTLKKYATGSGRADKQEMARAAEVRGWTIKDHNAVDALFLASYGRHIILPTMETTQ